MLHDATNARRKQALAKIAKLPDVKGKPVMLRVENLNEMCRAKSARRRRKGKQPDFHLTFGDFARCKNNMTDSELNVLAKPSWMRLFMCITVLGPGLLESVYEAALLVELKKRGLQAERQAPIASAMKASNWKSGFAPMCWLKKSVLVELKSVEAVTRSLKKSQPIT